MSIGRRMGPSPRCTFTIGSSARARLDHQVTGTDRGRLLYRLVEEHPRSLQVAANEGGVTGFLLSRPGSHARQIGPCIADEDAGLVLFAEARQRDRDNRYSSISRTAMHWPRPRRPRWA